MIRPASWGDDENRLHLTAVYRSDTVFGPAHRWVLAQLKSLCVRDTRAKRAPRAPVQRDTHLRKR